MSDAEVDAFMMSVRRRQCPGMRHACPGETGPGPAGRLRHEEGTAIRLLPWTGPALTSPEGRYHLQGVGPPMED